MLSKEVLLTEQSQNISNVSYSKANVNETYPNDIDKKKKSREHLKRFIYPKNDPEESAIIDSRSDQDKLMSVLRTLSCVLNPEQVDLWSEICQRDLRTTEQYKSSLPKLRSCILSEISQYKLSKKEKQ